MTITPRICVVPMKESIPSCFTLIFPMERVTIIPRMCGVTPRMCGGANERINPFLFCFNISDGNETSWDYLYVSLGNYVYNIFANNICVLHLQFCIFTFWKQYIYIYIYLGNWRIKELIICIKNWLHKGKEMSMFQEKIKNKFIISSK